MAGEPETGVTIMRVVQALDAGPMLAAARRPIGADDTSVEVERDLARIGAALLVDIVDRLAAGTARETAQDEALATYAHRLTKEDGLMDWSRAARDLHNQVRGLHPWPHAQTFLNGQRLIVLRSRVSGEPGTAPPGTILTARGDVLAVAAGSGVLDIVELQAEGRRPLETREFLAGHHLTPGDRFTGPA
jgi:methionyl-tRNA formyltransferase